ncbi:MAG: lpd [Bacteroidetes bacterium]|jgi:dihydrolipoamide dehydrogenase|nr:lpd [Bacteroidota bacterium]
MTFDIAIIGGGPAGYTAAEKAAHNGLKTILFEKKNVGGVCLNEGCIPTKTLLYSAKVLDGMRSAAKYGISVEGEASFDLKKIYARKNKTVRKLIAGIKQGLTNAGAITVQGEAQIVGEQDGLIEIRCGEETYFCKDLLLCTGSETIVPPIKGLGEVDFWTSREALEGNELPVSLAIIGGGVIGMEFASFFNSMGVKVSVIEMLPEILGAMDKETSAMLRAEYAKKGIGFHLNSKVVEVTPEYVVVEKEEGLIQIPAEKVLLSVGRKAVVNNLGLEKLSIETSRSGIPTNEYLQTNHPHVYACGDVNGKSLLAHTATREGAVAMNHILGVDDKMSYDAIPGVVYTNPEIAGIGKTEEELTAKGESYQVLKLPMAFSGRFVAENELGNGLCKVLVNDNKQIIGCHILGNPASEIIVVAGMAIEAKMTVADFKKIVFPHPTVGEILHELVNGVD